MDVDTLTTGAEEWTCACGRRNAAGLSLCPHCGRVPPRGIARQTTLGPRRDVPDWRPKVRAVRLAFGVIFLGFIFQVIVAVRLANGDLETNKAINVGLWGGFIFYAIVLAVVVGPVLSTRPRWVAGEPSTAALIGAEVGFACAALIVFLGWLVAGQPDLDANIASLVSEGTVTRVLLAVVYGCVAAPVVEELLFRGVVAESLRPRGPLVALFVSSLLFALWHLHFALFFMAYYTILGLVFGGLYWRRGLRASMAAHATFNGSLIVLALVVSLGPAHRVEANGVTVRAPGGWQRPVLSTPVTDSADLALQGPGGAIFIVRHQGLPPNVGVDLTRIAEAMNAGALPLPPRTTLVPASAHVATYPAGQAVEVSAVTAGHASQVLLLPSGSQLWEIDILTAGSTRAKKQYPDLLRSLSLPRE